MFGSEVSEHAFGDSSTPWSRFRMSNEMHDVVVLVHSSVIAIEAPTGAWELAWAAEQAWGGVALPECTCG